MKTNLTVKVLRFVFAIGCLLMATNCYAQIAAIRWDKSLGGSDWDIMTCFEFTSDGGYMLGGISNSYPTGDKSANRKGLSDYWLVKTDNAGNKIWDKTYGGADDDNLVVLKKTPDGGYILGGYTFSMKYADKSENNKGGLDFWLVKIDANGIIQWDKTIGGNQNDFLYSLELTADGGYIVGGGSASGISSDKSEINFPGQNAILNDYWVVKLDANGNKQWDKTFGGTNEDILTSIKQTADGGYIIGGSSASGVSGNKITPNNGVFDFWILKIDSNGNKQWEKSYGGNHHDSLSKIILTIDGGYILGGSSVSGVSGTKTEPNRNSLDIYSFDIWLIKIDNNGNKLWDKTIGGLGNDNLTCLSEMPNGNLLIGGNSRSPAGWEKREGNIGSSDNWVLETDSNGKKIWDKTFGGLNEETISDFRPTIDGGFLIAGSSGSGISGNKKTLNKGERDFWLVKAVLEPDTLGSAACAEIQQLTAYPNPAKIGKNVTIRLNARLCNDAVINVFNNAGKFVRKLPMLAGNNKSVLNLQDLSSGLYLIQVANQDMQISTKLLIP